MKINPLSASDQRNLEKALQQAGVAIEYLERCAACGLEMPEETAVALDLKNRLEAIKEHFGAGK